VTHSRTQVHEWSGNLLFDAGEPYTDHDGDAPYWALRAIFSRDIGGGASNVSVEIDGEEWTVSLSNQKSGLRPRKSDDVESLYEYRLNADGKGERKIRLLIQPRLDWESDERHPDGVPESLGLATNVRVDIAVNVGPQETRHLVPDLFERTFQELGVRWNHQFFRGRIHEYSNLTQLERYVRLQREQARKIVRLDGIFHRMFNLVANREGSKIVFSADNRDIVGHNHQVRLDTDAISNLFPGWRTGGQFKHYHPEFVGDRDPDDPLFHPKVAYLFKKKWNDGNSVPWDRLDELNRQVEENLMNLLEWADVPTKPGGWFVEDDHFAPGPSEYDIGFYDDPTPQIERDQDSVILRTISRLSDTDQDVLESVALTDGGRDVDEIAVDTGWSHSTIYRVLNKLDGLLDTDNGNVRFISSKIAQRVQDVLDVASDAVDAAVRSIEDILSVDPRDLERKGRAFQNWLNRYAADLLEQSADGETKIRIRTLLSEIKSGPGEYAPEIVNYGYIAWCDAGRDPAAFREARIEFDTADGTAIVKARRLLAEIRDDVLRIPG